MLLDILLAPWTAFHSMRELGGPVVDWIFAACLIMWLLVIERYLYFSRILPQEIRKTQTAWLLRGDRTSWISQQIRRAMISRLNAGMTSNLQLLRVLVPLCPLLGLVGTVSGMLNVFDSMAARGSADARSMANGVSEAMVCTLSGLVVSVTGLFPSYYFPRRARKETELLAERLSY
jgi:biopolymer transport protein ExbB